MSNINDITTVKLFVNGEQARDAMERLTEKAKDLENQLTAVMATGDKKSANKLQRELDKVRKELNRVDSAITGTNKVLKDLSNTSIHGLRNALKYLQREISMTRPNTERWIELANQINEVKGRLSELNEELEDSKGLWEKFKLWADQAWPALDLLRTWIGNFIGNLHSLVDAFALMDQEMANVRKFTGMTEAQVAQLNEEFSKIDTRTPREELNKLAQEAGRLGKTSVEDVLGFVRAADKINVALDDLGQGATLTLSKLTSIFGDEAIYGTEQSLLKVGSVINELSQNCSASAPYLAHFAERLGGVGAQAKLTIPQIMGFAAVLDSNAQAVEASSTALSQVIVRMMQEPAKYAKVAGLDVKMFADMLKTDVNGALILFLETLQKAGGMDVLSPMFKDMGENGSRAISALATLATNIDQVKRQQEAANVAFEEGTSIDNEFAVQNNTIAASLEKCRNRANELRVELGQYLQPLMSHLLVSTSSVIRAILTVIKFVEKNITTIATITTATTAYIGIMKLHSLWLDRVAIKTMLVDKWTKLLAISQKALGGVWASLKLGAAMLTNGIQYLKNGLEVTYTMQERWRRSMKAMSFGSWTGLILALGSAVYLLCKHFSNLAQSQKTLENIRKQAAQKMGEERAELDLLLAAARNEKLSLDERTKAIDKLNRLIPDYNGHLDETTGKYEENTKALDDYNKALVRKYELEGAKEKLAELGKQKAEATIELNDATKYFESTEGSQSGTSTTSNGMVIDNSAHLRNFASKRLQKAVAAMDAIETQEKRILEAYGIDLQKQVAEKVEEQVDNDTTFNGTTDNTDPDSKISDRFAKEKAWREREEAEARIAYATGQTTYSQHTAKMAQIAKDYYDLLLKRTDLSEDERLKIEADYWEAVNKKTVTGNKLLLDEEDRSYQELLDRLRKNHSKRLNQEELTATERQRESKYYAEVLELAELKHLKKILKLYEEGSDEWLEAQRNYQEKEIAARERHLKQMEELEKTYASMKDKYFGDNEEERRSKYEQALATLQVVYNRELEAAGDNAQEKLRIEEAFLQAQKALRQEYAQDSEEDTQNSYKNAIAKSAEWLKGEGGQALTGTLSTLVSGMSSIFSGLSSMIQAELEIQTAAIENKYDKEIEAAQGNSYKVAQLEKKKEREIAKVKNEANKKMFAMQVIQAVAQTAQNALSAYGSAVAVPIVGHILAPIAAAMAVAAGAIQIASIKKQQQASEAQGYSQGGFTKPGRVDEPAGIVHAGEWVASQKLLANPVARPMIEALDLAQRTNTIGSLRAEDVSRSITANDALVRIAGDNNSGAIMLATLAQNANAVADLVQRLNEPFVTINTVAGDYGINHAKEEYSRLMNNVTPKSKRK